MAPSEEVLPIKKLDAIGRLLVRKAIRCRRRAYVPYSDYKVGSALLDEKGKTHVGCNFENASLSLAICAERVAVGAMIVNGAKRIKLVVVVTRSSPPAFPCGACRQTLAEFILPKARVIAVNAEGTHFRESTFEALLPGAFGNFRSP